MTAIDVTSEIVIGRPRGEVAAYAADPDNAPRWYVNIRAVEWLTPPPLAQGSRVAFVAGFLGRRLAYTYEVVELVPGERPVMRTASGPFPMETTYAWQAIDADSSRMMLRNRGTPAGFFALFGPLLARMVRRANRKDLAALRDLLERRDRSRPTWRQSRCQRISTQRLDYNGRRRAERCCSAGTRGCATNVARFRGGA